MHADNRRVDHVPRRRFPAAYLRTVASLVPQHLAITQDNDISAMTDEELRETLLSFMAELLDEMGMSAEARAVRRKIDREAINTGEIGSN